MEGRTAAAHFNGKLSKDPVSLPSSCHPLSGLTTIAFRSPEVRPLLLAHDSCDCTDPLGMFPLFLKRQLMTCHLNYWAELSRVLVFQLAVTRGALVAHRHSFAPPRCRASQCRRTAEFISLYASQCLLGTIIVAVCLVVWDWRVLRAK